MDDETAELVLALQLQDLENVQSRTKGKGREIDQPSDQDIAIQLQQAEFELASLQMTDRRMAQSIDRAVQDDGATLNILVGEDNRAATDRDMACRLSGQPPQDAVQLQPSLAVDDDVLSRLSTFNIEDDSDNDTLSAVSEHDEAEGSAWATSRKIRKLGFDMGMCVACNERKLVIETPCHHNYCRECVRHLFSDATLDETLFPPRCCRQNIPVSLVRYFLGSILTARFERKAIEFGTVDKTYCSDPVCAAFIEPYHIQGSTGSCPGEGCETRTCILCKGTAHDGDCPSRDEFNETLSLAREAGWQRCRCQNVVELGLGCNHIT